MNAWMRISLIVITLAANVAADDLIEIDVSRLVLRGHARVQGSIVRLVDVVDFSRADVRLRERIGQIVLEENLAAPQQLEISHERVSELLDQSHINAARVLLTGALRCVVRVERGETESNEASAPIAAPLFREPSSASKTLADVFQRYLTDELASLGGTPEVEFEAAGRDFLELTTPPFEFSIRASRGPRLGLRDFAVTIRRDGRVQRTAHIGARVKLIKQVLVATRPLNLGTYITRDSLGHSQRIFASEQDFGIEHPEQLIGQQVKRFVAADEMIHAADVKPIDMVKRNRPVTLTSDGAVSIRATGVALDSGSYGDMVRVRLGTSRRDRRQVRGVVTGVGTVRMTEEGW